MTTAKTNHRLSPAQFLWVTLEQSRLALLASQTLALNIAPVLAWSITALLFGVIVGLAAVIFPPTGTFGIVSVVGLALLWVIPDFSIMPLKKTRILFFSMLVVLLTIPNYYTIQIVGLPWISLRRISLFPLIIIFMFSLAMSSQVRRDVVSAISANRLMTIGVIGFAVMIALSFLTSIEFTASMSYATEAFLAWFVPWFAALYVIRSDEDLRMLVKCIALCAVFVCGLGIIDFCSQRHIALDLMPHFLVDRLIADNPAFAKMVTYSPFRNGFYRASSIYMVSLSFGEFASMMAPIGLYYAVYAERFVGRVFGGFLFSICVLAVFCSGARGGWTSLATGSAVFISLWYFRSRRFFRHSVSPALVAMIAMIFFTLATAAVIFWPKAHNIVLGGGQEAYSTEARWAQWDLAKPHIAANPITGHGFGLGADIIDYPSIDSYVISLLVETGIPSLIFYILFLAAAIWTSGKRFLNDPSKGGAVNGAFASILVAYATYRLVLSQRENMTLVYVILGAVMVSNELYSRGLTVKPVLQALTPLRKAMGRNDRQTVRASPQLVDRSPR